MSIAVTEAPFLTTEQTAELLGVAKQTLDNWRSTGRGGPPYIKVGGRIIRYSRASVLRWMENRSQTPGASGSRRSRQSKARRRRAA